MNKKCHACETQEGKILRSTVDGNYYCKKHYMQMWRYGEIKNLISQNDSNEWEENICICRGIHGEITGKAIFDLERKEELSKFKIYLRKDGYPATKINGETILIHKLLTDTVGSGKIDMKIVVDHINGNRSDNRLENLRVVSQSINTVNRHDQKIQGVSYHSNRRDKKCWRSFIRKGEITITNWFEERNDAIKDRLLNEIFLYEEIVNSNNKKYKYLLNHSLTESEV